VSVARGSCRLPLPAALFQNHHRERIDVGLQRHQHADEAGQHDRMQEDVAQDRTLVAVPVGRGRGDDDRLRVDHLAHDAAGRVGGRHQYRRQAELFGGDPLQIAEQHVGGGVRSRQRHAEPAEQRAEEGIQHASGREGEAERGVDAREPRQRADGEHRRS